MELGRFTPSKRTLPFGTSQVSTSTPSRPACTAGSVAYSSARLFRVAGEHGDPAEPLVVLVGERAGRDHVALVTESSLVGEVGVLEVERLLLGQLRRVGRPHEQDERVPVELHLREPSSRAGSRRKPRLYWRPTRM